MGNKQQKKARRKTREAKEAGKRFNSFQDMERAVANGEVKTFAGSPTLESGLDPKPVPTTSSSPATTKLTQGKENKISKPMTKAGVKEYGDYFGLYAKSVRENRPFWSLGFIPGPGTIPEYREGGEVRILAATSDVARGLGTVPTPWMVWEKLPEKIRQARAEWKALVDGLGYEPSPYNLGLARGLLEGRIPSKYLAMAMPYFRYRPGDPEKPFGVVLLPVVVGGEIQGLKVKIYNPKGIPDLPADGAILALDELKNGRGPVQKLLRTTALMETNYLGRYDRDGNRLQQNGQS